MHYYFNFNRPGKINSSFILNVDSLKSLNHKQTVVVILKNKLVSLSKVCTEFALLLNNSK